MKSKSLTKEQREKKRKYQREWKDKRRRDWFEQAGPCVGCGETDISKLVPHHIDPNQKEDHRIWSWSKERLKKELDKCEVRCKKCHTEITYAHIPIPEHGTKNRYWSRRAPCRCRLCKDAANEWERNRLRKKRAELAERLEAALC